MLQRPWELNSGSLDCPLGAQHGNTRHSDIAFPAGREEDRGLLAISVISLYPTILGLQVPGQNRE